MSRAAPAPISAPKSSNANTCCLCCCECSAFRSRTPSSHASSNALSTHNSSFPFRSTFLASLELTFAVLLRLTQSELTQIHGAAPNRCAPELMLHPPDSFHDHHLSAASASASAPSSVPSPRLTRHKEHDLKEMAKGVPQRALEPDSACPICFEQLLLDTFGAGLQMGVFGEDVTYCAGGCGQSVHFECFARW